MFQKEVFKTQLETQQATLYKINEEIQDNIGQLLSSTVMLLGTASRNVKTLPEALKTAEVVLTQVIRDLRKISRHLNPHWLHHFNLVETLQNEISRYNAEGNIKVNYCPSGQTLPLSPEIQVVLSSIVQAAFSYCFAKQDVSKIEVHSLCFADIVLICLEDDSPLSIETITPELEVIKLRTELIGGTCSWHNLPSETRIEISIPVQEKRR